MWWLHGPPTVRQLGPPFCRLGIGRCARQRFKVRAECAYQFLSACIRRRAKTQHRVRAGDRPIGLNVGAHIDFFAAHGCALCRKASHRSVTATRSLLSSIFAIHSRNSRREKFAGQLSSGKCRSRRPCRVDKYSASNSALLALVHRKRRRGRGGIVDDSRSNTMPLVPAYAVEERIVICVTARYKKRDRGSQLK